MRPALDVDAAAGDALGLVILTLVVEVTRIQAMGIAELDVEARGKGVLGDVGDTLELGDVEVGVGGGSGQDDGLGRLEGVEEGRHRGNRARPRRRRGHGLHEVDAGVEPVSLVAQMEEGPVLDQGAAKGSAELVLAQGRLLLLSVDGGIEGVRLVERLVTEVLEGGAMELVGARLGDDRDLTARPRPVFRGEVAGFHPELLDIFEARLEAEGRGNLTVQVARGGVDDRGPLDSVVTDDVLLHRAPGEADVAEGAGAGVHRPRGLKVELGELAAVDREHGHLPLVHAGPDPRGGEIDGGGFAHHLDGLGEVRLLQGEIEVDLLPGRDLLGLEFGGLEAGELGLDGVEGGLQSEEGVAAGGVRHRFARVPGLVVDQDHGGSGDHRARGILDDAEDAAIVGLGPGGTGHGHEDRQEDEGQGARDPEATVTREHGRRQVGHEAILLEIRIWGSAR